MTYIKAVALYIPRISLFLFIAASEPNALNYNRATKNSSSRWMEVDRGLLSRCRSADEMQLVVKNYQCIVFFMS